MFTSTSQATSDLPWILKQEKEIFRSQIYLIESQELSEACKSLISFSLILGEEKKILQDAGAQRQGRHCRLRFFFFKLHEYHHINIFICEGSVILCRRVLMNKYTASKADLHWNSRSISTWAPAPSYLATIANQESNSENYRLLRGGIQGLSSAALWLDSNLWGPSNIYSCKGQRDEKQETMPGWEPR